MDSKQQTGTMKKSPGTGKFSKHRKKGRNQPIDKDGVNPLRKLQLSVFNNRYIPINPNPNNAYQLLPKKPMDFNAFVQHMALIRKYEVMFKIEFQV